MIPYSSAGKKQSVVPLYPVLQTCTNFETNKSVKELCTDKPQTR